MRKIERTLLVEDNEADVDLLKIAYEENKIATDLIVKNDVDEALDFLYQAKAEDRALLPQLILLDLNLLKRSGKEILKIIKSDPVLKSIPVIVMSTSNVKEDVELAYQAHANSYLVKKADFNEFLAMVYAIKVYWYDHVILA